MLGIIGSGLTAAALGLIVAKWHSLSHLVVAWSMGIAAVGCILLYLGILRARAPVALGIVALAFFALFATVGWVGFRRYRAQKRK